MKFVLKVSSEINQASSGHLSTDETVHFTAHPQSLLPALKLFAPSSFSDVQVTVEQATVVLSIDREAVKQLYSIITENGSLSLKGLANEAQVTEVISFMKLAGFTGTETNEQTGEIRTKRSQWQAAGAPLKRKKVETEPVAQANPWAALQTSSVGIINEDDLMKDDVSAVTQKFCGEEDTVKAGKACENCTCGKKE